MKKLLKWTGIGIGGLLGLTLLAGLALLLVGMGRLNQSYPDIPVETVSVPTGAEAIARGEHVAAIWSCATCHGDDLGGNPASSLNSEAAFLGTIPAPNLTPGNGGIGQSYTDADWVRAIRHGVTPDGRVEISMYNYWVMSDRDLGDLIAYLKQVPPVDASYPESGVGALYGMIVGAGLATPAAGLIDHAAPRPEAPQAGETAGYGRYLYTMCLECHSQKFAGKLAAWKQDDFIDTMHTGVSPDGERMGPAMTTKNFAALTDAELKAMWLYAQSAPLSSEK